MRKLTEEQKAIGENAVLIAVFEGYEVFEENGYKQIQYSEDNERVCFDTGYHTSWDWLMPVVGKVYDLVSPMIDGTNGDHENMIGDITCALTDVRLNDTHNFVVVAIKWYNENKED